MLGGRRKLFIRARNALNAITKVWRAFDLERDLDPLTPTGATDMKYGFIGVGTITVLATCPNIHSIPRSPSVFDTNEMDTTRNVLRRLAGEWPRLRRRSDWVGKMPLGFGLRGRSVE